MNQTSATLRASSTAPGLIAAASLRASLSYLRDTIEITRGHHDLLDALILTTALDANMALVIRAPDLQTAYGELAQSAPDDLRRPVSVNALAQSLSLPFETVRRRVLRLARVGLCTFGPQGVVVPNGAVTTSAYAAEMRGRYERARQFHKDLQALNAVPDTPTSADGPPPPGPAPLMRAVNWALSEYVLRASTDMIGLTGNVVSSRVLLELAVANIERLPAQALAEWAQNPGRVGLAVRTTALVQGLRTPAETVRRHLHALQVQGFCARRREGWTATAPDAARPRLEAIAEANQSNLKRLFARLAQLGVLAAWSAS